jgi:hypothetical protein
VNDDPAETTRRSRRRVASEVIAVIVAAALARWWLVGYAYGQAIYTATAVSHWALVGICCAGAAMMMARVQRGPKEYSEGQRDLGVFVGTLICGVLLAEGAEVLHQIIRVTFGERWDW